MPSPPPSLHVGERIAVARRRRGMSRKILADFIGRSEEWLRQIEKGQRRLDSIEYALRLARALRIDDLPGLLGLPDHKPDRAPTSGGLRAVEPIRETLMDSVAVRAFAPERAWDEAARTLDSDVVEAQRRWQGSADRYHRTLAMLPRVLRGAASRLCAAPPGPTAAPAIAAYHLTRTALSRVGEDQLAWLAADRALIAAARSSPAETLAAAWHVSACYLRHESFPQAYRFAMAAAEHGPDVEDDDQRPLLGALWLIAAHAAASLLDVSGARELLERARGIAATTGDRPNPYLVPFGRTEVGISAVHLAIRLGQTTEAIRLAAEVDIPDEYPADRQARYYIPLAHLYSRRNEDAAAVFALGRVAATSPEDLRYDRLSREALYRLLRRNNLTVRRELSRLARLAGIS